MNHDFQQILNCMDDAVAAVEDGVIAWCNDAAMQLGLMVGASIDTLLPRDVTPEDLRTLSRLSLPSLGPNVYAQVHPLEQSCLLILRSDAPELTYSSLAQTARALRSPMDDILFTSRTFFAQLEEMEDPIIQAQTARLNRGFYRLMRTINSLTELHNSTEASAFFPSRIDLVHWLRTLCERACSLVETTGRKLEVRLPHRIVFANVDVPMLEDALFSLLSNAVRYSPPESVIRLQVDEREGQCLFRLSNPVTEAVELMRLADGFNRAPDLKAAEHGLGLGLLRAQHVARQHGGVLLLECTPTGAFVATLRIRSNLTTSYVRMAPMTLERSGGYDRLLIELSDLLPDEVFDTRSL